MFFSGTGNTKWAVNEFCNNIDKKNHICSKYSIEDEIENIQKIIYEADMIGFAYPIYGAELPKIMRNFLDETFGSIELVNKKCFVISTVGYVDGCGPLHANSILKKINLDLIGYIKLKICNNISTPTVKSNFVSKEVLIKRLSRCQKKIDKLIEKLISDQEHIRNIGPYLIAGILIRRALADGKENSYSLLSVDINRCSSCMLCVNNCPTKSITYSDDNFSFFTDMYVMYEML